jgi:hypothetical protein
LARKRAETACFHGFVDGLYPDISEKNGLSKKMKKKIELVLNGLYMRESRYDTKNKKNLPNQSDVERAQLN